MTALLLPLLVPVLFSAAAAPLTTLAERTGFARTGRYDEVLRLCDAIPARFPGRARCLRFGMTPEGRPMVALVASEDGALTPALARERRRPVVLFQGGIHAGEIDGKDAGLLLLRDLLLGHRGPGLLKGATVILIPVYNVDGHERFGPNNRPNQIGPAEMGWRTTAQNLNLNRDYCKAEAKETAALLSLLREWDPVLYVDLHVTDGADFQPDIAVMVEPRREGAGPLVAAAQALSTAMQRRLAALSHMPLPFYPSFLVENDPSSGFAVGLAPPRFQSSYWPQQNRLAVLIETHAWKDFRTRVRATSDAMLALLEQAREHGPAWLAAAAAADKEAPLLLGTKVPLAFENTEHKVPLRFPGYAYRIEPSPISGGPRVRYDGRKKTIWEVPLFDEVRATATATAPRGGYLVPAAHGPLIAEKLRLHGLRYVSIAAERTLLVEAFRVSKKTFGAAPYEGRQTVQVEGRWQRERRVLPAGSLYVPMAQRGARLLLHLLDPAGPDSLLFWGFFNAHLEQKEYLEPYVAETVAEEMLRRDPALAAEFVRKLRSEPAFSRDPAARLRFFHERHGSWDERLDLYPIYKIDEISDLP